MIRHESYSSKADVYSFALLLWQLLTHELPFAPLNQIEAAGRVAVERARPPIPSKAPESVVQLMVKCWDETPDCRHPSEEICSILESLKDSLPNEEKFWLSMPMGHPVYALNKGNDTSDDSDDELIKMRRPSCSAVRGSGGANASLGQFSGRSASISSPLSFPGSRTEKRFRKIKAIFSQRRRHSKAKS